MPFTPKVGDKFRLLDKEWEIEFEPDRFASNFRADAIKSDAVIYWPFSEANKLDWIKPEVKFSKEQVKAIEEKLPRYFKSYNEGEVGQFGYAKELYDFLDAHTE